MDRHNVVFFFDGFVGPERYQVASTLEKHSLQCKVQWFNTTSFCLLVGVKGVKERGIILNENHFLLMTQNGYNVASMHFISYLIAFLE